MKKLWIILPLFMLSLSCFAQEVVSTQINFSFLDPIINFIVTNFGSTIVKNMAALYFVSIIFKPLFSLLITASKATTWTIKDDEFIANILNSNIYKAMAYVLDVIARIKLPKGN